MTDQTFIYENVEVTKTGRTAKKTLGSGKIDILFEITPTNVSLGAWKKWVRNTDLFEVQQ